MANQTVNLGPVRGENGTAASIRVGSVTTGEPGTPAKVVNSGTSSSAILDFTIPKGADGEPGAKGDTGNDGKSPYQVAVEQGYTGTEAEFYAALVSLNDAPFLSLSGGTMEPDSSIHIPMDGLLSIGGAEGSPNVSIWSESQGILFIGGTYGNSRINGVANPQNENDAANKQYVDSTSKTNSEKTGVPIGCILLWSGSSENIPTGWHLCDGQQGTPDLRGRFVVGAGLDYKVDSTGGEVAHTLTTAELPSHSHGSGSLSAVSAGEHIHSIDMSRMGGGTGPVFSFEGRYDQPTFYNEYETKTSGSHTHAISGITDSIGAGTAHNNLPPYYALCYIMRIS